MVSSSSIILSLLLELFFRPVFRQLLPLAVKDNICKTDADEPETRHRHQNHGYLEGKIVCISQQALPAGNMTNLT